MEPDKISLGLVEDPHLVGDREGGFACAHFQGKSFLDHLDQHKQCVHMVVLAN